MCRLESIPFPEFDPEDPAQIFLDSDEEFEKKLATLAAASIVSQECLNRQFTV